MSDIQLIDKPFTKVLVRPERGGDRHSRLYNKEMNMRNNRTGHVTNTTSQVNPVSYIYITVCWSITVANTILLLYYVLSISYILPFLQVDSFVRSFTFHTSRDHRVRLLLEVF